jgi:hypothetical protein
MQTDSKNNITSTNANNVLVAGLIVSPGNFKLKKKIETLDEFWEVINTEKSFFARHRMYPTAFFFSWQIRSINHWLSRDWFWVTEPCH